MKIQNSYQKKFFTKKWLILEFEKEKNIKLNYLDFKRLYFSHPNLAKLKNKTDNTQNGVIHLKGLLGSSTSMFVYASMLEINRPVVIILPEKEDAAYFYNDLVTLHGEENVLFFPSAYKRTLAQTNENKTDSSSIILRTEVLSTLINAHGNHINNLAIITYPEALVEKVIARKQFETHILELEVGAKVDIDFIIEVLMTYHFDRVDFVYEAGQYAVRGSIIDIFSYSNDYPYRIDFFGEEVESIRTFDVVSQLSKDKYEKITIVPDVQTKFAEENRISFLNYLPESALIWTNNIRASISKLEKVYENTLLAMENDLQMFSQKYLSSDDFIKNLEQFTRIEFGILPYYSASLELKFDTLIQPPFKKNFQKLCEDLTNKTQNGFQNIILSNSEKQFERLKAIFESEKKDGQVEYIPILTTLHEGFIDNDLKTCCYTDHQIFERYQKYDLKSLKHAEGREALTLKELTGLQPGDYVVHIDHGIGIFGGLVTTEINGKKQEVIQLVYQDKDILFVSIHSLHRISKYKGKDGEPPKIYKLGSGAWQKLTQKTKSKVKDIAKELIALYAKRKEEKGFQYSPDSYLQQELEASFIYEDTPDQIKSTAAVKKDMESEEPMDRLICGDVGFGKTEVAIRAAFKAVTDSKQVAVLVPTTILALQHYKTFSDRLKGFPCNVDYISRLKTAKAQKETIKKLQNGQIDILIGTHRIVSEDIKFKDLGLLVIDEEQKFGVAMKEKLKRLKVNVDTLTLTATPIPRTLQFSLMGARDLSVINTPPPNRFPIITELHTFNEDVIREAINYEIDRNGQVFFIHNRIDNIVEVQDLIKRLCPHVRSVVAHGQMDGPVLEKIMLDFINEEYGVLIATTIVESGLDIPNANTIIINNAQNFGLSDLHQLRGRVGRSNKKAFCYLLAPPASVLTSEARRRLSAIENFSELGSGFNIALQDLDIRGAGNILGAEQSGFIADIGFETYQRILAEALLELKENEFKEMYNKAIDENETPDLDVIMGDHKFVTDCQIDTDLEVLFPEYYIENIAERMNLYRELDNITDETALEEFEKRIIDRFGKIPKESKELLNIVRLRWIAIDLGIERIILKNHFLICYFVSNQDSPFYQSSLFTAVLEYVQKNSKSCRMKEANNKLSITIDNVKIVKDAIEKLKMIKYLVK